MPKARKTKAVNDKVIILKSGAKRVIVPRPKTYNVSLYTLVAWLVRNKIDLLIFCLFFCYV